MTKSISGTVLIIPCFNEEDRIRPEPFLTILDTHPGLSFLFVDDGSTDTTWRLLTHIETQSPERISILKLEKNRGKAEAIREGVLRLLKNPKALGKTPEFLGYWDADLSTPLTALPLFMGVVEGDPNCRLVMGSRVRLLGRDIRRNRFRHYAGRIFSTLASIAVDLPVYDTQCGAKIFRVDPDLREVFAQPFSDPWIFDVEILSRLHQMWGVETRSRIVELPLPFWKDVGGSKVRLRHGVRAFFGLVAIWHRRSRGG